jgi:hypothetical protein
MLLHKRRLPLSFAAAEKGASLQTWCLPNAPLSRCAAMTNQECVSCACAISAGKSQPLRTALIEGCAPILCDLADKPRLIQWCKDIQMQVRVFVSLPANFCMATRNMGVCRKKCIWFTTAICCAVPYGLAICSDCPNVPFGASIAQL